MAKMTFTKWLKQAKANTKIIEKLEQIKYDYEQGKDLSYDDLAFLQFAGIDESDWNKAHTGGNND